MIILIAESKNMRVEERLVSPEEFEAHCPVGETAADEVMAEIARMNVTEIASEVKVTGAMAMKLLRMAYEFPNKGTGLKALDAYTGVVFRTLDPHSFSLQQRDRTEKDVRIISSLYGWLKPDDIIKPYRLDFTTRLAPGDKSFSAFWRQGVTVELVRELKERGETDILNLLPGDASKCIDWKLVKRFASVWKVDFRKLDDGETLKTPHATLLKEARGELLRNIIVKNVSTPDGLETLATERLLPMGKPDYPDRFVYCVS